MINHWNLELTFDLFLCRLWLWTPGDVYMSTISVRSVAIANLLSFWTLRVMLWIKEDLWREQWPFMDYMLKIRMSKKEGIQKNWGFLFIHIERKIQLKWSKIMYVASFLVYKYTLLSYVHATMWLCSDF